MIKLTTVLTYVFNIVLGVLGMAIIASQISSGQGISFEDGIKLNLRLYNMGLVLYLVLLVGYFWGVKKYLGKTAGGLLADKITGKRKK